MNNTKIFKKLNTINPKLIKKIGLDFKDIEDLKTLILNDKLGLKLNFKDTKEDLSKTNYILFKDKDPVSRERERERETLLKSWNLNLKDKNNNLLIEGENYYVLKALKTTDIKIDVIYIDPPYNTGNEFIYNDKRITKDDSYTHSKWLSFMKKRLELARDLLKDDGVIFVSIDDNEQAYLKVLMDEIFGENNFLSNIVWISNKKGRQISNSIFVKTYEYILVYSKNKLNLENNKTKYLIDRKISNKLMPLIYENKELIVYKDDISEFILLNKLHNTNINEFNIKTRPNLFFSIFTNGKEVSLIKKNKTFIEISPPKNKQGLQGVWRWSKEKILKEKFNLFINKKNDIFEFLTKKREMKFLPKNIILSSKITTKSGSNELEKLKIKEFKFPKPSSLIKFLLGYTSKNTIILDFFAGSGTTGQAVMELNQEDGGNRRFILITNSEKNICKKIAYERLFRVIKGKGSNNEKIDWRYSNKLSYLKNNSLRYLEIEKLDKFDGEYENIDNKKQLYKQEFNKDISIKDFND